MKKNFKLFITILVALIVIPGVSAKEITSVEINNVFTDLEIGMTEKEAFKGTVTSEDYKKEYERWGFEDLSGYGIDSTGGGYVSMDKYLENGLEGGMYYYSVGFRALNGNTFAKNVILKINGKTYDTKMSYCTKNVETGEESTDCISFTNIFTKEVLGYGEIGEVNYSTEIFIYDENTDKYYLYDGTDTLVEIVGFGDSNDNLIDYEDLEELSTKDIKNGTAWLKKYADVIDVEVYLDEVEDDNGISYVVKGEGTIKKYVVQADDTKSETDKAAAKEVSKLITLATNGEEVEGISETLIDAINDAIANDKEVTAEVASDAVEESKVSDTVKEKVTEEIKNNDLVKGASVLGYFDINLEIKIDGVTQEDTVHNLTNEIEVSVDVKDLVSKLEPVAKGMLREYKVIRIHNNESDVLDADYNENTGMLTFKTDRFSDYIVTTNVIEAPNTLDNTTIYFALAMISVVGMVLSALYLRKEA
ncbi:MAG: hypothetical protein IJ565_02120 [Bacilli bacterium]|nr:hypothetical protein [Bacilli bacterium]